MSQNWLSNVLLTKNSNLTSLASTNAVDSKNGKTEGSSSFSDLLSAKINLVGSSQSVKSTTKVSDIGELKASKKLESPVAKTKQMTEDKSATSTTPSKDKVNENQVDGDAKVEKSVQTDEKSDSNEASKSVEKTEETLTEEVVKEENTTQLDSLLQLINALVETEPELGEALTAVKSELEALVQAVTNQTEVTTDKVDSSKVLEAISSLEEKIETLSKELTIVKPELMESLKSQLNQLSEGLSKATSFEAVVKEISKPLAVATKEPSTVNTQSTTTPQVSVTQTDSPVAQTTEGQTQNSSEDSFGGSNKQETSNGNSKATADVKIQAEAKTNQEAKTTNVNFVQEMNAKIDSASVAFAKTDVAQAGKTTLQQNIMDQIMNSPRLQIKQTELGTSMTMKLNPEVLGNVEIKLEIVKNVLQAEINVENLIVKGAIEANLSDLKNALSDKGYDVETLNVSVGKDAQDQRGQQQRQNEQASRYFMEEEQEASNKGFSLKALDSNATIDYLG